MRSIDDALAGEEAKWRAKPYEEIEQILGTVYAYGVEDGDAVYEMEVHTKQARRQGEIVVMVECSVKKWWRTYAGKARYFVKSKESGVRDIEDNEAF